MQRNIGFKDLLSNPNFLGTETLILLASHFAPANFPKIKINLYFNEPIYRTISTGRKTSQNLNHLQNRFNPFGEI